MRIASIAVSALLIGSACNAPSPSAAPASSAPTVNAPTTHPADIALGELAAAFEREDIEAVRARVSDGWSGSRFMTNWTHDDWRAAAASLRAVVLKSSTDTERVYALVDHGTAKNVTMNRMNGKWALDYSSFKGPFPHP